MDLSADRELEAFRAEVNGFLDAAATDIVLEAGRKTTSVFAPFDQVMAWQKLLYRKGWVAPTWPVEHGGTGWTPEQVIVFESECQKRGVPPLLSQGLKMIGPLLIDLGDEAQKARYLPRILSGEDFWCQGYSEPNAGSDLASLSCAATSDGEDYVINGSKIWTTYAHHANRMFMLVRTSQAAKKQQGITFLLLDGMDLPGMEVRPIIGLDGVPEQCEVFFRDVRVPKRNRVGAENDGWSVAKHLLRYERGGRVAGPMLRAKLAELRRAAARATSPFGEPMGEDPAFQQRLGRLETDICSLDYLAQFATSGGEPSRDPALPSIIKTLTSELTQELSTLMLEVAGLEALPQQLDALRVGGDVEPLGSELELIAMPYYLNSRAASIYGGSNEVQRDLIARSVIPR